MSANDSVVPTTDHLADITRYVVMFIKGYVQVLGAGRPV